MSDKWIGYAEVKGYIENLNNVMKLGTTDNIILWRYAPTYYHKIISCTYLYRILSWKHFQERRSRYYCFRCTVKVYSFHFHFRWYVIHKRISSQKFQFWRKARKESEFEEVNKSFILLVVTIEKEKKCEKFDKLRWFVKCLVLERCV